MRYAPLCFLAGLLLAPTMAVAQQPRIVTVRGIVGDTLGRPIRAAEVVALKAGRSVRADSLGVFTFVLPAGAEIFVVRRTGYAPQAFEVTLPGGDTIRVGITLDRLDILPEITIVAEGRGYPLYMSPFVDRMTSGTWPRSSFITTDQIDRRRGLPPIEHLARAGMPRQTDRNGRPYVACPRGGNRANPRIAWFVNGMRQGDGFDINSFSAEQVAAMEVHKSLAEIPIDWPLRGASCVVGVWLRQ